MTQSFLHWHTLARGVVRIVGQDSVAFIQRMCTQDVRPLATAHQARLALFLNARGRLIDEVLITSVPDGLLIETAANKARALVDWLTPYTIMEDVHYEVVTECAQTATVIVAAHTPFSETVSGALRALGIAKIPEVGACAPGADTTLWAHRARRALGLGITVTATDAVAAQQTADAFERAFGPPLSAYERKVFLVRSGVATAVLKDVTSLPPFELRLGTDAIHWHKGCYIGQEVISRLEAYDKVARLLMGIEVQNCSINLLGEAADARVLVSGQVIGKLNLLIEDVASSKLIGFCTLKRDFARAMAVQVSGQQGRLFNGMLFNCPQWQP